MAKGPPKFGATPKPKKQPKTGMDPDRETDLTVAWRFEFVDMEGHWAWSDCRAEDIPRLLGLLIDYEKQPRRVLQLRRLIKDVELADLKPPAKARLREIDHDDEEVLWELRFGYRDWRAWVSSAVTSSYLIWWDPEHTVCGPPPKGARRR